MLTVTSAGPGRGTGRLLLDTRSRARGALEKRHCWHRRADCGAGGLPRPLRRGPRCPKSPLSDKAPLPPLPKSSPAVALLTRGCCGCTGWRPSTCCCPGCCPGCCCCCCNWKRGAWKHQQDERTRPQEPRRAQQRCPQGCAQHRTPARPQRWFLKAPRRRARSQLSARAVSHTKADQQQGGQTYKYSKAGTSSLLHQNI